jgi:hypothetical protein
MSAILCEGLIVFRLGQSYANVGRLGIEDLSVKPVDSAGDTTWRTLLHAQLDLPPLGLREETDLLDTPDQANVIY